MDGELNGWDKILLWINGLWHEEDYKEPGKPNYNSLPLQKAVLFLCVAVAFQICEGGS